MAKPNILYIHSHDTGRYVQPYGHAIPTPNIQRLAEEGVLFRQAFSAAPTCGPSRAALTTGQCCHSTGMMGQISRGFSLNDHRQHMVHTLRGAGYTSALVGIQHIARDRTAIGYDRVIDLPSNRVEHVAPAAAGFLGSAPEEPFFLSVGFKETHRPYPGPSPAEDPRYVRPPSPLGDHPQVRRDMAGFVASARVLDEGVGQVLAALESTCLSDRTMVICTTDHGVAFPGMKGTLTDHGIGVMLIMRGPGWFSGERISDALVSHVDIYRTVCDLLRLEPHSWLQGTSIMPLLRGQTGEVRDRIFAETNYHATYDPQRAIRTKRWKYIRRFDNRHKPVPSHVDDSPSKDMWLEQGWADRFVATEQLFDLIFDPLETRNVAGDPSLAGTLADLRIRLDKWMVETDDPLLCGPVPPPSGARLNDPDDLSPHDPPKVVP